MIKKILLGFESYLYNGVLSKFPCYIARHSYLATILKIQLGKGCAVHMGCHFAGRRIRIGNHTIINRDCYLDGRRGSIEIGDNVSIGMGSAILTMSHDYNSPDFASLEYTTIIKDRAFIGIRAIILPGITIGEGAVIGAGSVVTKNVEPYKVVAGNPARIIADRNHHLTYELNYRPPFNSDV